MSLEPPNAARALGPHLAVKSVLARQGCCRRRLVRKKWALTSGFVFCFVRGRVAVSAWQLQRSVVAVQALLVNSGPVFRRWRFNSVWASNTVQQWLRQEMRQRLAWELCVYSYLACACSAETSNRQACTNCCVPCGMFTSTPYQEAAISVSGL